MLRQSKGLGPAQDADSDPQGGLDPDERAGRTLYVATVQEDHAHHQPIRHGIRPDRHGRHGQHHVLGDPFTRSAC